MPSLRRLRRYDYFSTEKVEYILDKMLPHLHLMSGLTEGPSTQLKKSTLLFLAVTLHNIPEGLAVGLSFALAAREGSSLSLSAALVLAIGIGLQNLPEGAAISLPLRKQGVSSQKAFAFGFDQFHQQADT